MDQEKLLKDDCNFLEWPLFALNDKGHENNIIIEKSYGKYKISCSLGLPDFYDKKVLYCLIQQLYEKTLLNSYNFETTRYKLARGISSNSPTLKQYKNIKEALERWANITIRFEGIFYENGHHITKLFHIIESALYDDDTGRIKVRFSSEYIDQLRSSQFYKIIDFQQYRTFTRATSARLYELLSKNLMDRDTWLINFKVLAEKLGLKKNAEIDGYYRSDVIRKLKPCVAEVNSKTELYVSLGLKNGSDLCAFNKIQKSKQFLPAITDKLKKQSNNKEIEACYEMFQNLPADERSRIERAIEHDSILSVLHDQKMKLFSYMKNKGLWQKTI